MSSNRCEARPTAIFYANASNPDGFTIKVLAEILKSIFVSDVSLLLSKEGISVCNSDNKKTTLVNMLLLRENFKEYKCTEDLVINFNIRTFYTLLKNVKKKIGVILFINKDIRNKLGIKPYSDRDEKKETSYLTITPIRRNITEIPECYDLSHNIPSNEFQNIIKKMQSVSGKIVKLSIQKDNFISFYCGSNGVADVEMEFGELLPTSEARVVPKVSTADKATVRSTASGDKSGDGDSKASLKGSCADKSNNDSEIYEEEFYTKLFTQLIKLPGFGKQIQFYSPNQEHYPLRIKMLAGKLGYIDIYIKDKYLVDLEEKMNLEREGRN